MALMSDQKNLILAIVLSVLILIGFQFLVEPPAPPEPVEGQEQTVDAEDPTFAPNAAVEGVADPEDSPGRRDLADDLTGLPGMDRAAALDQVRRLPIDTPRVHGSLSLQGARLDDLTLADYRETVDPESPEIVLLSPLQAPQPYYADFGWIADGDVAVPGPDTIWSADRARLTADQPVTLSWDNGAGQLFETTVAVDENFMFSVTQRVINNGDEPIALTPYGRILRSGTPETSGFFILHEGPYGVFESQLEEFSYDGLQDDGVVARTTTGGWLGFTDKYWLVALVPDQQQTVSTQFVHRLNGVEDRYFATFRAPSREVPPGSSVEASNQVFAGAKEVNVVDQYSEHECLGITRAIGLCQDRDGIEKFDLAIDFGWFYFLTKPFFFALAWINGIVGNFGVAILIFTVFIKLLFFPLANKSYRAMSKMKALQPQMLDLRERFKDDKQKMNMELMQLYKREKVNPASGCLPILIQIPVFFALYKVLFVTIEMRHAPFFGWIQDLSAPDPTSIFNLFGLIPIDLPLWLPAIGIWPLIMGVSMFAQQKLNPPPTDPLQQRIFMALPIVFTFLLAGFPAGLVIYWAWNNILSIAQQAFIMKQMGVKIGGGVAKTAPAGPPPSAQRKQTKADAAPANPGPANPGPAKAEGGPSRKRPGGARARKPADGDGGEEPAEPAQAGSDGAAAEAADGDGAARPEAPPSAARKPAARKPAPSRSRGKKRSAGARRRSS